MSIESQNMSNSFAIQMEEVHNKQIKTFADIFDTTAEFVQSQKQSLNSAVDALSKKCQNDDMLFESIQIFRKGLEVKNVSVEEKQLSVSAVMSEIQEKEMQKKDVIQEIEKLKEKQTKKRELIENQNKVNKKRLKNLQTARLVFQDHLAVEIRTVYGKNKSLKGENLQFVFRNIHPSDEDSVCVVTMGLNEKHQYQIFSTDPPIKCLPVLESRLQETNNLAAFLANVRREFINLIRC